MAQYNLYLSGEKHVIEASADEKLDALRRKLADKANNYQFVYYNSFTEKKTILNDSALESRKSIKDIVFPDNTIIMALVRGNKTDLFGTKTDWLHDRHLGIQVVKNDESYNFRQMNADKFDPQMLTDVQPSNESSSAFYPRVVICEKGTVIQFKLSSWGSAGFGCRIRSDKEVICNKLYLCLGDFPNRQTQTSIKRYQDSNNSIQIESTKQLGIPTQDVVHYQKVTVTSWRVTSYEENGKTFTSDTYPPTPRVHKVKASKMLIGKPGAPSGGFDPGQPAGNIYVPGRSIETGAPTRGPESGQRFTSFRLIQQDDPENTVLGAIVFYFFVFKNKDAANRVINVLNAPNPNAIG